MAAATQRATRVNRALKHAVGAGTPTAGTGTKQIRICAGTACHASGRAEITKAVREEIEKRGLAGQVTILETGCHGFCELGPILVVDPSGTFYPRLKPRDVADILQNSVVSDEVVERLLYRDPKTDAPVAHEKDIPFYKLQHRLVLSANGKIDPHSIDDYLALGGYSALAKVLADDDPVAVIDAVETAGLRGRGGAGFPAGRKWRSCRANPGEKKYVLCNGDEGDPGAFMDRSVLEGNPHAVIEGMIIAAFAISSGVAPGE